MARASGFALGRDGDLIGEGFTGGPVSQAAPFPSDYRHDSAWVDSLPHVLNPDGTWGVYGGSFLGEAEAIRERYVDVQFMFFPGAASKINAAFRSAFHR